jgi:hypothetical protein
VRLNKITFRRVFYDAVKTKSDLENLYTATQSTVTSIIFKFEYIDRL